MILPPDHMQYAKNKNRDDGKSDLLVRVCAMGLQIDHVPIATLVPNPRNPRKRQKKQKYILAKSYKAHGFINPIIVDENSVILAGHGRYEAAKQLSTTPRLNRSL